MPKTSKIILVAILLSLLSIGTQNGLTQTENNQPQLYVRLVDNTFKPENAHLLNGIFEEFQLRLKQHGISASTVIASAFERPFWHLSLRISQHDNSTFLSVSGNRFQNPFSKISTLLADNYGPNMFIEFTTANQQAAFAKAVDLTTALGLFASGLCEQANPFFQEFINELEPLTWQTAIINGNISASYFYQAGCAIFEEDFHSAVSLLEKGLSYYESSEISISYATWLAWAYLKAGQVDNANSLIESLVENSRDTPGSQDQYLNALISRAQIHALASQYPDAIDDLNLAIELMPAARLYLMRGQMYLAIYEWDKAGADFDHALEVSPNYAEVYFHRGVLYYSILQTGLTTRDDALADFRRYLELTPDGEFAAQAAEYVDNIQREPNALDG
jgi:tetratricopeptide (TPR) repeat protein